jgi:hypothetical protein
MAIYIGANKVAPFSGVNQIGITYFGNNVVFGLGNPPPGPSFTPADIAKYWWTADAGVTESGGAVSSWQDQVGGLDITQSSATLKPVTGSQAALNNQNIIRFDGSNDYLQRSPISFLSDGYSFSLITVHYYNAAAGSVVAQSRFGIDAGRLSFLVNSGDEQILNQGFSGTTLITVNNPASTGSKVEAFEYDAAGSVRVWYNDLSTPTTYSGGNANQDLIQTTSLIFGAYNGESSGSVADGFKLNGDIAEVIWVPRTLTAEDLTNLQTYINTKYGLSV